jgi:hypothetical protein
VYIERPLTENLSKALELVETKLEAVSKVDYQAPRPYDAHYSTPSRDLWSEVIGTV